MLINPHHVVLCPTCHRLLSQCVQTKISVSPLKRVSIDLSEGIVKVKLLVFIVTSIENSVKPLIYRNNKDKLSSYLVRS